MERLLLFRRHHSRNTLFLLVLLAGIGLGLLFWNLEFINSVYFRDQLTSTGHIINGSIAALFLLGMIRIVVALMRYVGEDTALCRFIDNMEEGREDEPLKNVSKRSLVATRYFTMKSLHKAKTSINQSALASTLVASESTHNSLVRFINNILILTGVFGTIVSLSIALLGASDMLEGSVNVGGMGIVIHGMSTALSTTITAIICYIFFGFFHLKLNDVQTNLISGIEQITTTYLTPRFQVKNESVLYEFTDLIRSLQILVRQMEMSQAEVGELGKRLNTIVEAQAPETTNLSDEVNAVKQVLIEGFQQSRETSQASLGDLSNRLSSFAGKQTIRAGNLSEELGAIKKLLQHGFRLSDD